MCCFCSAAVYARNRSIFDSDSIRRIASGVSLLLLAPISPTHPHPLNISSVQQRLSTMPCPQCNNIHTQTTMFRSCSSVVRFSHVCSSLRLLSSRICFSTEMNTITFSITHLVIFVVRFRYCAHTPSTDPHNRIVVLYRSVSVIFRFPRTKWNSLRMKVEPKRPKIQMTLMIVFCCFVVRVVVDGRWWCVWNDCQTISHGTR